MSKDPYANSPYDAAGMPEGTTYADYDNADERRRNQVKTKPYEEPVTVFDMDYTEPETEAIKAFKERRPETKEEKAEFDKNFNSAIAEQVNVPGRDQVTIEDIMDEDDFLKEEPAKKDEKK